MLKLTMNLPAEKAFFSEDDGIVGAIFRFTRSGDLQLRPTSRSTKGPDFVPLMSRSRGGIEFTVNGDLAKNISEHLLGMGVSNFYLISSNDADDWLTLQVYEGIDKYPPRTKPHLRAWNLHAKADDVLDRRSHPSIVAMISRAARLVHGDEADETTSEEDVDGAQSLLSAVREAAGLTTSQALIAEVRRLAQAARGYGGEGDKSDDALAAEETIIEIRTIVGAGIDATSIRRARDLLNLALDPAGDRKLTSSTRSAEDEVTPDLSTSMGSERADHERRTGRAGGRSRVRRMPGEAV